MSQFSTLGVSECATLFFLDSTNISAAVYSRYKRPMFNSYLEWQRCSPARWQAVWKTQSGVVHNTASKLAPWYDCASLQSAFGRSTPLSPVGTASPLSNSISLPTASLQEQAVNETSAPHLHRCPPTTTSHYSGHSPNWRLCVCVCTGACRHSWKWHWTFFSNSRVAFDWRAAEHCCGCSLRFSAGMPPPVFFCCLWFLLTHTVQLLHCYNTTCNFNDLFKFTSQMKFFVSSYMWRASVCCLLIRTHTTHTEGKKQLADNNEGLVRGR